MRVHVLRDNERCSLVGVCGNKARKLATLAETTLPAAGVVSHGGAQSNAMLALASLCRDRGSTLTYHTRPIPAWLRASPQGNLAAALATGSMHLIEHASLNDYEAAVDRAAVDESGSVFVPQGAAWPAAEQGIAGLAREIGDWHRSTSPLDVVVPSGTGTTALYLAH